MTKFVDCLVQLPNLRTLDIFRASDPDVITRRLQRECIQFPSIRELLIANALAEFVGSCPGVESIAATGYFSRDGAGILGSHVEILKNLKCLAGIRIGDVPQSEFRDTFWFEQVLNEGSLWKLYSVALTFGRFVSGTSSSSSLL